MRNALPSPLPLPAPKLLLIFAALRFCLLDSVGGTEIQIETLAILSLVQPCQSQISIPTAPQPHSHIQPPRLSEHFLSRRKTVEKCTERSAVGFEDILIRVNIHAMNIFGMIELKCTHVSYEYVPNPEVHHQHRTSNWRRKQNLKAQSLRYYSIPKSSYFFAIRCHHTAIVSFTALSFTSYHLSPSFYFVYILRTEA